MIMLCRKYGRLFNTLTHSNRNTLHATRTSINRHWKTYSLKLSQTVSVISYRYGFPHTHSLTHSFTHSFRSLTPSTHHQFDQQCSRRWKSLVSWTVKWFNQQSIYSFIGGIHHENVMIWSGICHESSSAPNGLQEYVSKARCLLISRRICGAKSLACYNMLPLPLLLFGRHHTSEISYGHTYIRRHNQPIFIHIEAPSSVIR